MSGDSFNDQMMMRMVILKSSEPGAPAAKVKKANGRLFQQQNGGVVYCGTVGGK